MPRCFQVNTRDNVATMLETGAGQVTVLGGRFTAIHALEAIQAGHKIALEAIPRGSDITKFGISIGSATQDIRPGEWVHLHNCASHVDERSQTLDVQSGISTDISYE